MALVESAWETDEINSDLKQLAPFLFSRGASKASEESGIFRSFLHFRPLQDLEMSTTLLSAFYDIDFFCKVRDEFVGFFFLKERRSE